MNKKLENLKDIFADYVDTKGIKRTVEVGREKRLADEANLIKRMSSSGPSWEKSLELSNELAKQNPKFKTEKLVTPEKFREARRQLDQMITSFQKDFGDAPDFQKSMQSIRGTMKDELIKAAEQSGNPEYIQAMKEWSDNLQTAEKLKSMLGRSANTREQRVQPFIDNLMNRNKGAQQNIVQKINPELLEKAKNASYAKELGDNGTPGLLPRQTTGRSLLGFGTGTGLIMNGVTSGDPLQVALGLLLGGMASPRIASTTLGLTDDAIKAAQAAGQYMKVPASATRGISGGASGISNAMNDSERRRVALLNRLRFQGLQGLQGVTP